MPISTAEADQGASIQRMRRALSEYVVMGIKTNIIFHEKLLSHPLFVEGRYSTGVGSIIELTDAQASLASAEANDVQALVNYRVAVATLERAIAAPVTAS